MGSSAAAGLAPAKWTASERQIRCLTYPQSTWANLRLADDTQVGIGLDLRERKAAERALRAAAAERERQRDRLALAQSVARVGLFEWTIQTGREEWSPEVEALYGLAPGTFEGTYEDWTRRVHPDDLPEVERRVRAALETGNYEAEWRALWPDGTVRWLGGRGRIYRDAQGRPERMLGLNIDITEHKRMRDADRRKTELLAVPVARAAEPARSHPKCHRPARQRTAGKRHRAPGEGHPPPPERSPRAQRRPMACQPGMHHELVLIDQSQLRQRQRKLHASHEQSLARLPFQLPNSVLQMIPAYELRIPIHPLQSTRHNVLLCRVDR
jgi:PAS domain S-box-containing protein